MLFVLIVRKLLFKITYLFTLLCTFSITGDSLSHLLTLLAYSASLSFLNEYEKKVRCFEHWKAKLRFPCKVCSKPTSSKPGLYRKHSGTYYVTQYINRLQDKARKIEI